VPLRIDAEAVAWTEHAVAIRWPTLEGSTTHEPGAGDEAALVRRNVIQPKRESSQNLAS
jgi:hypothetical protein